MRHPSDVQGLPRRDRAVVEYDPKRRWRVIVLAEPPGEWAARALRLDPEAGTKTGGPAWACPRASRASRSS
ncbi:hypothetical protein [Streptomyces sp. AcE210]|uniref:hypothetical protein n=1 Tax=Streptomyces sp. AcE210 TaxID=2292703 RepID=UPI000E2FF7DB|nr:hypothetical protein [Streptomyces sp. AcE210]RFC71267.1 hypothetical protein DXZ75_29630 [Streptomyces sp. AcE210]